MADRKDIIPQSEHTDWSVRKDSTTDNSGRVGRDIARQTEKHTKESEEWMEKAWKNIPDKAVDADESDK